MLLRAGARVFVFAGAVGGCVFGLANAGWLLAEDLVPGKKRRKMSETITSFFCEEALPCDPPPPDSQLER